jgi:pimeloyl-ACP methyl ester carboxylesterase
MPSLTLGSGSTVTYGDAGSGMPLVLVHGSPGEGRSWSRVVRALGDGLRILMPDLPGYGRSAPLADTLAPAARTAAMAEAIGAVIHRCTAPVLLCGHSYGGNVVLHAAAANADRVRGIVLLEPVFFRALALSGDTATLRSATAYFGDYVRQVDAGDFAAVRLMIDYWFGTGAYGHLPDPVREFLVGAAAKNARDVAASLAESLPRAALAALQVPAIVACGSRSPPVAMAIARALADLLPDAAVDTIDGATHGMLDSHPDQVAGMIRRLDARPG